MVFAETTTLSSISLIATSPASATESVIISESSFIVLVMYIALIVPTARATSTMPDMTTVRNFILMDFIFSSFKQRFFPL